MPKKPGGTTSSRQLIGERRGGAIVPRVNRKTDPDRTRQGPLADEMVRELQTELYLVDRTIAALMRLHALRQG
jgi:hypothetical protein